MAEVRPLHVPAHHLGRLRVALRVDGAHEPAGAVDCEEVRAGGGPVHPHQARALVQGPGQDVRERSGAGRRHGGWDGGERLLPLPPQLGGEGGEEAGGAVLLVAQHLQQRAEAGHAARVARVDRLLEARPHGCLHSGRGLGHAAGVGAGDAHVTGHLAVPLDVRGGGLKVAALPVATGPSSGRVRQGAGARGETHLDCLLHALHAGLHVQRVLHPLQGLAHARAGFIQLPHAPAHLQSGPM